jgi:hypothetical protein
MCTFGVFIPLFENFIESQHKMRGIPIKASGYLGCKGADACT